MARTRKPLEGIQREQHWYRAKISEPVHEHVCSYGKTLQVNEASEHSKARARIRIYEGRSLMTKRNALQVLERSGMSLAKLNALKAVVDTFVSRMSKDRPMPAFDTEGAEWSLKRQAKKFRQFIVGKMTETEFDDLSRETLQDGAIQGTGWTLIDGDDDVFAERITYDELLFDRRECKYGKPRSAIRIHRIAKDYLTELHPEHADEIHRAGPSIWRPDDSDDGIISVSDLDDYVDVWEAWHLPSTRDSDDGRHVLCVDTGTLVSEEWLEPRFPWAMFRLFKPSAGLHGNGFVDQLADLQHRVNCIVRDLQMNLAAFGRGYIAVNSANDVPVETLTGWQPFKLKYEGAQPPQVTLPPPFNPAQLSALQFFIQQMFDLTGVSQASATSKSALGAGASGAALDTQYDIDSDRFRMPQANYARYRLEGAQRYLDAAARVARRRKQNEGKKRSWTATSWKSRDSIEQLDYSKVALQEGQYKLKIEPVNFLPDTRAGKLSIVEQLAKAGVIPQWLVPTLFDDPDLVQMNRITLSAFRNCLRKMEDLTEEDVDPPVPEPFNDLDLELKISIAYYNWTQEERAPEEIQERFRNYIGLVENALQTKKQGEAPPAPPPGMAPAEQPMPGGIPPMPQGPVPQPEMIGAPPLQAIPGGLA